METEQRRPGGELFTLAREAAVALEAMSERLEDLCRSGVVLDAMRLVDLGGELATVLEQASFALEELGAQALEVHGNPAPPGWVNPRAERALRVHLSRAARRMRTAAAITAEAAPMAMLPELAVLHQGLDVRLAVPDMDPPWYVDVHQGIDQEQYEVRWTSFARGARGRPVSADRAQLVQAIATAAGLDAGTDHGLRVATALAREACERLEVMAEHRDAAKRHVPSPRLPSDPPEEWAARGPAVPRLLVAALCDLADRDGERQGVVPVGAGLAMALAEVARSRVEWQVALTGHPEELAEAADHVRALLQIGRRLDPGPRRASAPAADVEEGGEDLPA